MYGTLDDGSKRYTWTGDLELEKSRASTAAFAAAGQDLTSEARTRLRVANDDRPQLSAALAGTLDKVR